MILLIMFIIQLITFTFYVYLQRKDYQLNHKKTSFSLIF